MGATPNFYAMFPGWGEAQAEPASDEKKRWRVFTEKLPDVGEVEIHELDPSGLSPDELKDIYLKYSKQFLRPHPEDGGMYDAMVYGYVFPGQPDKGLFPRIVLKPKPPTS